jgi:type I restriction enzyme S subunit
LTDESFLSASFPLPPLPEQAAIIRFLDHADTQIGRHILAKQKLIKLLNEQEAAIVNDAVTRGLDRSVELRPSGVQWLGDIPLHWEVVPFKRRVGFQEGPGIMAEDFRDEGVPLLRISCLGSDEATLDGCNYLAPEMVQRRWKHFAIEAGDYLLSASASTGAVVLATDVVAGAIPYTGIIRLWSISEKAFMPFVRLFMGCRPFQDQIDEAKSGVGIEHFGPTHLKRMIVLLPPFDEQRRIVAWVTSKIAPTAALIASAQREIDLLREYRGRLIADLVTGKVDVREAGVSLSDKTDADETREKEVEVEDSIADIDREAVGAEFDEVEA